ncbi:MAG: NAD(P)H-binding protein [Pseudomonadota bacterium]|nr:NAD(P)H-binding protein [Pseudomonadota bacterium]
MIMKDNINSTHTSDGLTLVLGGTGKTGRRIVQRLESRGVPTRAASRSAVPVFDWNDPDSWNDVLEGVTAAYINYAPDLAIPGAADAVRAFVERAVVHDVKRLVILSGRGEEEARHCERIVQNSGIEWTIVRASWFNQNFSEGEFLGMVLDGLITLPAGDVPEPFIDVDDIADVAVAALSEDGHVGQIYEVTGPHLLTFTEVAEEIARASGREIQYIKIPREDFAAGIADSGLPDDIAWLLDYLFSTVLDGRNARVCNGVQRALNREPKDFVEYARKVAESGVWDVPLSPERAVS